MKTILIAAVFTLLGNAAFAEEALETRTLLEGKVTMLVPASFAPLPEAAIKAKYPGRNGPTFVLSNADTDVNLALAVTTKELPPDKLKDLEAVMRQQIGEANINASGIRYLSGHQFLLFNFDAQALDGKIRSVMAMASYEGKLLVITYNCLVSKNAGCDQLGSKLIGSIKLAPEATP